MKIEWYFYGYGSRLFSRNGDITPISQSQSEAGMTGRLPAHLAAGRLLSERHAVW